MSWINMLSWWQWLIMAAIPPLVVLLYFLKLRRTAVIVPSTYLWRRTIEDLHVNSIWQRLRQNLLMWLQLLVLLLIILACLRPGHRNDNLIESRSILLIDNSASMQANDLGGNPRLEVAKQRALEMVAAMRGDDVAMVIAFRDQADVRQGYTADPRRLRRALESIQPTNRTTDLVEALRTASGLANPGRTSQVEDVGDIQVAEAVPATVYILSDGGFETPPIDLDNLTAQYIALGDALAENVGIIAFGFDRNLEKEGQAEAFARIQNFGGQSVQCQATLRLDDQVVDAAAVSLEAGQVRGLAFELSQLREGRLELRLDVDDHLPVDNVAYIALAPPKPLEVLLVTRGNATLQAALATPQAVALANVRVVAVDELESDTMLQLAASGSIDLMIYDDCAPAAMPAANTLFLGGVPPSPTWNPSEPSGPLFVIDVNRSHPLMQFVDLNTTLIAEGLSYEPPRGGVELARTDAGILMAVAAREAYQDIAVGMKLLNNNTNWINRRGFPVFILNCLEYLAGESAGVRTIRPGQQAVLNLGSQHQQITIETPSGRQLPLHREGQPQWAFSDTEELGTYLVRDASQQRLLQAFSVNLFSERESDIRPAEEVLIGLQAVEAQTPETLVKRREYWRWLLALALVGLSLEWYLYGKRVAV